MSRCSLRIASTRLHCPTQVAPAPIDPGADPARAPRGAALAALPGAQPGGDKRGGARLPLPDGLVAEDNAARQEHLGEVPQAQVEALRIAADRPCKSALRRRVWTLPGKAGRPGSFRQRDLTLLLGWPALAQAARGRLTRAQWRASRGRHRGWGDRHVPGNRRIATRAEEWSPRCRVFAPESRFGLLARAITQPSLAGCQALAVRCRRAGSIVATAGTAVPKCSRQASSTARAAGNASR